MERVSINHLASAVLAITLIMLYTATAPVLGRMPSEKLALLPEGYEVVRVEPSIENGKEKTTYKWIRKQQQAAEGFEGIKTALLKRDNPQPTACGQQGDYCNPDFGIICCRNSCLGVWPAGGICIL